MRIVCHGHHAVQIEHIHFELCMRTFFILNNFHLSLVSPLPQWVYNVLDGKAEQDRMIYQDPHPETGFVLLPDFKWDQKDVQNLYLLAIVRRRDLLSLRELNEEHLPLLKNVLERGQVCVWREGGGGRGGWLVEIEKRNYTSC